MLTAYAKLAGPAISAAGGRFLARNNAAKAYEAGASRAAHKGLKSARVRVLSGLVRPYGLIDPDRGLAMMGEAEQASRILGDPMLLARTQMLAAGSRLLYDRWRREEALLCISARRALVELSDSETPPYHKMIYAHVQALKFLQTKGARKTTRARKVAKAVAGRGGQ